MKSFIEFPGMKNRFRRALNLQRMVDEHHMVGILAKHGKIMGRHQDGKIISCPDLIQHIHQRLHTFHIHTGERLIQNEKLRIAQQRHSDADSLLHAKAAVLEFVACRAFHSDHFQNLDGAFRDNVILQIKNGPVDFQPREPFSPLFGLMPQTQLMAEFQITQEYLGFSNHLVYLIPLFKECLDSDTYCEGPGSTIADITTGKTYPSVYKTTAVAGVANIGRDENWCGHHFAQSSWYGFGRMAWDVNLTSEEIAQEWIEQTFISEPEFVEPVLDMMMTSREAAVDYMMPLGFHHIFAWTHHYGPEPWCEIPGARVDWLPKYYHKADSEGVGFDRTRSGSGNVDQYHEPLASLYNSIETCPEELLLWFHHAPWDHKMSSGRTLWDEICHRYDRGIKTVQGYVDLWNEMKPYVDAERWEAVRAKLEIQESDARWWRDACVQYFMEFSGMPVPSDVAQPERPLEELKKIKLDMKHHN